jgi:hypothetical protein
MLQRGVLRTGFCRDRVLLELSGASHGRLAKEFRFFTRAVCKSHLYGEEKTNMIFSGYGNAILPRDNPRHGRRIAHRRSHGRNII